MKKSLLVLIIICCLQAIGFAQLNQNRSTTTKIADLLASQPAENPDRLADAMQQLEQFEASELTTLLLQLQPWGSSENVAIQYAINSYALYLPGLTNNKGGEIFNRGVLDALEQTQDADNKRFLIGLLRTTANDACVPTLEKHLVLPEYAQSAANVLGELATTAAGNALLNALQKTTNEQITITLINTLGRMAFLPAEQTIINKGQTASLNPELQKTIYAALARIAGPQSEILLSRAAQGVNYQFEKSGATAALLDYATNLLENGEAGAAKQISAKVLKTKNLSPAVKTRALGLLVAIDGEKQINNLLKGAKDADPAYRQVSLSLLSRFNSEQYTNKLTKNFFKAPQDVQASILQYIGSERQLVALPVVQEALYKGGDEVNAAAALSLYQLMGDNSIPLLLSQLSRTSGDYPNPISSTIEGILLTNRNPTLEQQVIRQLTEEKNELAQVTLLQVIGQRHFKQAASLVMNLAKNEESQTVKNSAILTLPNVANAQSLPDLLDLLSERSIANTTDQTAAQQNAIINVIQNSPNPQRQLDQVLQRFQRESALTKTLYFAIFAQTASKEVLEMVNDYAFEHENQEIRNAAITSLGSWATTDAMPALIRLSRLTNQNYGPTDHLIKGTVVRGLIRQIGQSELPAAQKVLLLRDLFDHVSETDHKRQILRALETTKSFNAMQFAGQFLADEVLKSAAANTVMGIALDNPQFNGQLVVDLLHKVSRVLSGSESSYLREAISKHIAAMPKDEGFVSLFNGENLDGWKGLVANPIRRAAMDEETLAAAQIKADEIMRGGWYVADGELHFNGKGDNIATVKQYGNFEMLVDWKLAADGEEGDAGIYLRGTPQVQVWDTSRVNVGAQVGSGGLYNNQKHPSKPLLVADNLLGEWNTFRIIMIDDRVTVYLNGYLVTDNVVLENYWDRSQPIFPSEQIELQAHGTHVSYRDIYIKELPTTTYFEMSEEEKEAGFTVLFDGRDMDQWTGNTADYTISPENTLAVYPKEGSGGNLYTKEEFGDFIFRFSFRLTPGANNGVGIRTPMEGDAAYVGMEIQVLDNEAEIYRNLKEWQYHGSVYGIIAAKRGHLKPLGEWNEEEIFVRGDEIRVTLNGTVILEGNLKEATKNGTLDGQEHPGLKNTKGHIGFLGHGSEVHFKDIRIKRL